jgi:hypothetical protein
MTAGIQLGVNLSELPNPPQNFFSLGAYGEEIVIKDSLGEKIVLGEAATPGYGNTTTPGLIKLADTPELYDDTVADKAMKPEQMPIILNTNNRIATRYAKPYVTGNHAIVFANSYSYVSGAYSIVISGRPSPASINMVRSIIIGNFIYDGVAGNDPISIGYASYTRGNNPIAIGKGANCYYEQVVIGSDIDPSAIYPRFSVGVNGQEVLALDSYNNELRVSGINFLGTVEATPMAPTHKVIINTQNGDCFLLLASV